MINKILTDFDILDDLKRKDHVVFNLPRQGQANGFRGYSFVARVIDEQGMSQFLGLSDSMDLGTVISHEDEANHVWYHGIVNHCQDEGWEDEAYEAITEGLNFIALKFDTEMVRPMRSLWLGRGRIRAIGDTEGSIVRSIAAMANSDAELNIHLI